MSDNYKNCGAHGDSSFMFGALAPSSEKPMSLGMGCVTDLIIENAATPYLCWRWVTTKEQLDAYVAEKCGQKYNALPLDLYNSILMDLPTFIGCVLPDDRWKTRHRQYISWHELCSEMTRVRRKLFEYAEDNG